LGEDRVQHGELVLEHPFEAAPHDMVLRAELQGEVAEQAAVDDTGRFLSGAQPVDLSPDEPFDPLQSR